jgi:hypothetical protein
MKIANIAVAGRIIFSPLISEVTAWLDIARRAQPWERALA